MTDIELVIKIPEDIYKDIMAHNREMREGGKSAYYFEWLIQNGTSLPKGHGRLIDADALPLNDIDDANYGSNYIRIAPTIIEAEMESEE